MCLKKSYIIHNHHHSNPWSEWMGIQFMTRTQESSIWNESIFLWSLNSSDATHFVVYATNRAGVQIAIFCLSCESMPHWKVYASSISAPNFARNKLHLNCEIFNFKHNHNIFFTRMFSAIQYEKQILWPTPKVDVLCRNWLFWMYWDASWIAIHVHICNPQKICAVVNNLHIIYRDLV